MHRLLVALLFAGVAAAQVYVVDAQNGPGTHFTSIATAVAAVPSGAVLQVRSGTYGPFVIQGKSLAVLGEPGVVVADLATTPIQVQGLAAHQTVVLRELDASLQLGPAPIVCQSSTGAIVIDACRADHTTSTLGGRVVIANCAQVHVRDSSFLSGALSASSVTATASNVSLSGCTIGGFGSPILINGGLLEITACAIVGVGFAPAIQLNNADLRCRGNSTITGAQTAPFFALAINGTGNVRIDPNTTLVNVPSPPFGPGLTVTSVALPWLAATPAALGGTSTIQLSGSAGGIGAIFVGFPGQPTVLVPGNPEPIWLLPASIVLHAIGGATSSAGQAVPSVAALLGVTLTWQGVALATGPGLQLSNPVATPLH